MKKITAFLAAAVLLTACNPQTNDKAVSDPIEQTPAEPVFMEYHETDFTDIPVKLNKQETAPPINVESYDLTGIEFEKKQSPCALTENRDKFLPQIIIKGQSMAYDYSGIPNADAEKGYFDPLCEATLPSIEAEALDDENLYYIANYDNICGGFSSHCYDIYRYSIKTGENTCVYSYSDISEESCSQMPFSMMCYNGSLWLLMLRGESYTACRLDEENGEFTDFHDFPKAGNSSFYQYGGDKLMAIFVNYTETGNETSQEYILYEYIGGSNEWREIYSGETPPKMYCEKIVSETVNNRTADIESEYFLLHTGIRGAELEAVSENCLTLMTNDSISTILYTYNLKKKERYVLDLSNLNQNIGVYPMDDNIIMGGANDGHYYYAIPELGSYFDLMKAEDDEFIWLKFFGEKTALIKCSMNNNYYATSDGLIYEPLNAPVLRELIIVG